MLLNGFSLLGVPYYYSDGVVSLILLIGVLAFSETLRQRLALFLFMFSRPPGNKEERI